MFFGQSLTAALHKGSTLRAVGIHLETKMKNAISQLTVAALFACAAAAHAQTEGQTVRIAFMDPLSGPFANVGQNQLKSWQFIAERMSGKNNPAGVKFEVVGFDNKG